MKKIISSILSCTFGVVLASTAVAVSAHSAQARGGSDNPFPLDYPIKFPWSSIEGIWQIVDGDVDWTYSFKVQSDCHDRQILKVFQIDPKTGNVIAEGTGYKDDNSSEVFAVMKGRTIPNYVLHIGAFKDTHAIPPKRLVILRVLPFSAASSEFDYQIEKQPGSLPIDNAGNPPDTCGIF